jgi:hypothetical protein
MRRQTSLERRQEDLAQYTEDVRLEYTLHKAQCRKCHAFESPPRLCPQGRELRRRLDELQKENMALLDQLSRSGQNTNTPSVEEGS